MGMNTALVCHDCKERLEFPAKWQAPNEVKQFSRYLERIFVGVNWRMEHLPTSWLGGSEEDLKNLCGYIAFARCHNNHKIEYFNDEDVPLVGPRAYKAIHLKDKRLGGEFDERTELKIVKCIKNVAEILARLKSQGVIGNWTGLFRHGDDIFFSWSAKKLTETDGTDGDEEFQVKFHWNLLDKSENDIEKIMRDDINKKAGIKY